MREISTNSSHKNGASIAFSELADKPFPFN
jgi:hypothetical protein